MRRAWLVGVLMVGLVAGGRAAGQVPADFASERRAEAKAALDRLEETGEFGLALKALDRTFDLVTAYGDPADVALFLETALARRIAHHASKAPGDGRELVAFLRRNPDLGATLVMLVNVRDDLEGVYGVLARLRRRFGDAVTEHPSLTAAICVVRDKPLNTRVNENVSIPAEPEEVFEYYRANETRAAFGVRTMPAELLLSVVDMTVPITEARWALETYGKRPDPGKRYGEIKYDFDHLEKKTPKKVTEAGFTLANIAKYGGICADQAHFAANVGRAAGVPCAYVYGRNAEVSHAWVGFLQMDGARARWNFDSGRYDGYKGVRGVVRDPQTGYGVPESVLAIRAESIAAPKSARQEAAAYVDAAARVGSWLDEGDLHPPPPEGWEPPREWGTGKQLALIEAGLKRAPWYSPGWEELRRMADAGQLSLAEKKRWAKVLETLCGAKYPDFTLDILSPMVENVEDAEEQDAMWETLARAMKARPDLVAEVRFAQGRLWEKHKDLSKAWGCYHDVGTRLANEGPFAVDALRRCEALLYHAGKFGEAVALYENAWKLMKRPGKMAPEFAAQSNWVRVGLIYADVLERAKRAQQAEQVRKQVGYGKK